MFACNLFFTGCATTSSVEDFSPNNDRNSQQVLSPFSDSKIKIAQKLIGKEDWIVIMDNPCAAQQQRGLAQELYGKSAMSDMERQAYRLPASKAKSEDFLIENCVLGASLEVPIRTFALPKPTGEVSVKSTLSSDSKDPLSSFQQHLNFLGFFDVIETIRSLTLEKDRRPVIAIVDTGVDDKHEDLKDVMWSDNEGHHGRDLVKNDNEPMDEHGHGTHVAGLAAAASENGIGISGIGRAQIMAVRVLDSSGATSTDVVANGIIWAADHGADVINLSLGGEVKEYSPVLLEALTYAINKNVLVVAAAGNDGLELSEKFRMEPAGLAKEIRGLISVGSVDSESNKISEFSNFSSAYVELLAPGAVNSAGDHTDGLLSTVPGRIKYSRMAGTSMATPVVSGAAALIIARQRLSDKEYTAAELEEELLRLGRPDDDLKKFVLDGRVLDLKRLNLAEPVSLSNSP